MTPKCSPNGSKINSMAPSGPYKTLQKTNLGSFGNVSHLCESYVTLASHQCHTFIVAFWLQGWPFEAIWLPLGANGAPTDFPKTIRLCNEGGSFFLNCFWRLVNKKYVNTRRIHVNARRIYVNTRKMEYT